MRAVRAALARTGSAGAPPRRAGARPEGATIRAVRAALARTGSADPRLIALEYVLRVPPGRRSRARAPLSLTAPRLGVPRRSPS